MSLDVGHRTYIDGALLIHSYAGANEDEPTITVGRYCSIAAGVELLPGGMHRTQGVSTFPWQNVAPSRGHAPTLRGDIRIGDDVWVCRGARILGGVTIGTGAIVGAWAVVRRDVPPYHVAVGNPASTKPRRSHAPYVDDLLAIAWWDWADDDPRLCDVESMGVAEFCATHALR